MLFQIIGARKDNGQDIQIRVEARDVAEAHQIANQKGILVASCTPMAARPAKPPAAVAAVVSRTELSDGGGEIPLADERPAPMEGGTKDCPRCGESVKAKARICRFCGHAFDAAAQLPVADSINSNSGANQHAIKTERSATSPSDGRPHVAGLAIVAFVVSFFALVLSVIAGVPAIILGTVARNKIKKNPTLFSGLGLANTAIILGMAFSIIAPGVLFAVIRWNQQAQIALTQERINTARIELVSLESALVAFELDVGHYPATEEGLQALTSPPAGARNWKGPYLQNAVQSDPWGNPYIYLRPGIHNKAGYDLYSRGPDGIDSHDDIDNWSSKLE